MKKITVLMAVVSLCAGVSAFGDTVYLARAAADPARLTADLAGYDFDVALASADGYFEIVAYPEDLVALDREGISYDILDTIDTTDAPPSEYTEYAEMVPILQNLENTYPNICKLYDIGDSWENREIWALKISDNVATHDAGENDILINGCHHAREIMTVEVPLYLAQQLCEKYATDPEVKLIVDNVETWIIPMLNPDGHNYVFTVYNMWRKNRRDNGGGVYGVDPNRNYDYHWGESGASHNPSSSTYCGPNAFSEPEIQALRDLINGADHQFIHTLNYHSYGKAMLYPWAYTSSHPPEPDYQYYKDLAAYLLATLPGWEHGNDWEVLHYLASGNAVDWGHDGDGHDQVWDITFEIDTSFQPPASQIPVTCAEQYTVLLKLLKLGVCELPVKVSSFEARTVRDGVALGWVVSDQRDVAGFNLYHRPVTEAPAAVDYVRLNNELITGRSPYEFVDGNATAGAEYEYLLEGVDLTGGTATFGPTVGRAPGRMAPRAMALYQNRPNPARGVTTITFDVAEAGNASVEVFDLAGRRVRTLYDGPADAGAHEISWNLADDAGRPVPPGVYLYRLESAGETTCRRLVAAY